MGYQDNHENKEASERDQEASERDQNEISAWDQTHENACEVSAAPDQNNENAHDASAARDQNNENVCRGNTHLGGTKEKQMTYREALLLGLDNPELSSDF